MNLRKKVLSLTLALGLCLSLTVPAVAAAPEAALRDVQTHYWMAVSDEAPELILHEGDDPLGWWYIWGGLMQYAAKFSYYVNSNLTSRQPAHFMLYDNGDLYLSTKEDPDAASFAKVMSNVKEIGTMAVPLFKWRMVVEDKLANNQWATYSEGYVEENVKSANLTTVLNEDGELYLMGCPTELSEENCYHLNEEPNVQCYQQYSNRISEKWMTENLRDFRTTVTIEKLFPFSYQRSLETAIVVANDIEHIIPKYEYQVSYSGKSVHDSSWSSTASENKGFYIDKQGNSYFGFPTTEESNQMANENVIDYMGNQNTQMLEDGALYRGGSKIAHNVKDFGIQCYLTNDGKLYDYDGNHITGQVKAISDDGYYYITEDDSLYYTYDKQKIMEDVATIFDDAYPIRSNGDVYRLDSGDDGTSLPKKMLSGNGFAPNPAPTLHEGKVFKDASEWALIDLRAARNSGLTLPVGSLSYNEPITREKFAEIAVKLYEKLSGKTAPTASANPFTDTENPEILKAYSLGIVKGTSTTAFSPQEKISRESIAAMLKRTVDLAGTRLPNGSPKQFADANQISSWARESVDAMAGANIVKGVSADRFSPKDNASIEQAVIMANRISQ